MRVIKYAIGILLLMVCQLAYSQITLPDSAQVKEQIFDEVVISANKVEESKKNIAQPILLIQLKEIQNSQSQSTADLLLNTGNVFVQKSQMGGGSPVIRGFESNRILLVVDGVRLNNIIYRGGHLQNIVTLDNNILEKTEVLFGPSSTVYGSDALGGVIHLFTKKPELSSEGQNSNFKANAFLRYGSVNNEFTGHLDFNIGSEKFAFLTSITFSKFGDLKGGKNQNPFYDKSYGERPRYVERVNNNDSLVNNGNINLQKQSGFSQFDLLQKFLFQQNKHLSHSVNLQYSNSSNVPRYDRLTDPDGEGLSYAQWYYGPQERLLTAYDLNFKNEVSIFQNIHFGVNYQDIQESRHSRKFDSNNISHRFEDVKVFGTNLDFLKNIGKHSIRVGIEGQFNTLKSTANKENIVTGEIQSLDTRYPDGDNTMLNGAVYLSHTWQINKVLVLTDGIRAGFVKLQSTFVDTSFYHFPYNLVEQKNPVYSGTIGLIASPSDNWKLSFLISTGYRVPNVDDLSKVFESAPGAVIVPNPDLKPEKTINYEVGITKFFNEKAYWENSIFYIQFIDAIITGKFKFNNQDSIIYDGAKSVVMANQNKQRAYLTGFSSNFKSQIGNKFQLSIMMNYTYGRIKSDSSISPLGHIPPLMARLQISYSNKKFGSDFFVSFNGAKKLKDYFLNGEDNEQYATKDGMPAWVTANLRVSFKIGKQSKLQAGIDNIFDTQYRTFASGINAPGRNIFVSFRIQI